MGRDRAGLSHADSKRPAHVDLRREGLSFGNGRRRGNRRKPGFHRRGTVLLRILEDAHRPVQLSRGRAGRPSGLGAAAAAERRGSRGRDRHAGRAGHAAHAGARGNLSSVHDEPPAAVRRHARGGELFRAAQLHLPERPGGDEGLPAHHLRQLCPASAGRVWQGRAGLLHRRAVADRVEHPAGGLSHRALASHVPGEVHGALRLSRFAGRGGRRDPARARGGEAPL